MPVGTIDPRLEVEHRAPMSPINLGIPVLRLSPLSLMVVVEGSHQPLGAPEDHLSSLRTDLGR